MVIGIYPNTSMNYKGISRYRYNIAYTASTQGFMFFTICIIKIIPDISFNYKEILRKIN